MIRRILYFAALLALATSTSAAKVFVTSNPDGANIWVDGKRVAKKVTPAIVEVETGEVEIRLEKRGFSPWTTTVDVTTEDITHVEAILEGDEPSGETTKSEERMTLDVLVESPPSCYVFVNGHQLLRDDGTPWRTPCSIPDFPPGRYAVRIAKEGHVDLKVPLIVKERLKPIKRRLSSGQSESLKSVPIQTIKLADMRPEAIPNPATKRLANFFQKIEDAMMEERTVTSPFTSSSTEYPRKFDIRFEPALMIGMRYRLGAEFGATTVQGIQPIYLTPRGNVFGSELAPLGDQPEVEIAKEGYAVGLITVSQGIRPNGAQFTYFRITSNGLDPNDSYTGRWIGSQANSEPKILGTGTPIVGLGARVGGNCDNLAATYLK